MGQQQLLLIILGIIIIGIAITVGISLFNANATESKRNNIINDLVHLASEAQKYYRTPKAMGGGQLSFEGWQIPKRLQVQCGWRVYCLSNCNPRSSGVNGKRKRGCNFK